MREPFSFFVEAVDQGSTKLTSTANIVVSIEDENDNTPVFESDFYNTEVDYQ